MFCKFNINITLSNIDVANIFVFLIDPRTNGAKYIQVFRCLLSFLKIVLLEYLQQLIFFNIDKLLIFLQ